MRILAPAKLNLGLAVLGKRPDGYHDIDTIMAMIDLADVLTIRPTSEPGITIRGMDDVPVESNAVTRAIRGFCNRSRLSASFHVDVEKRIPSPAGLGGGSSDAAATLKALDALFPGTMTADDLHQVASSIGADCPFFLGTPAARATGTGTTLQPIAPPSGWVVIVVPPADIEAKTATLYGSLEPGDYLTSPAIDRIEDDLATSAPSSMVNSFTRAARSVLPGVNRAWEAMIEVTETCALTGAGPAVYALTPDELRVQAWRDELMHRLPEHHDVVVSKFLAVSPTPEPLS
jgi:4-diphosphocytidyl-2-C-methyl-D-erythritol kinase